uniref:60S ribosomal protein L7a n=1 Tax=Arcella intermedia TaxID=1963864 RepID=A0A6B2LEF0_9EUKA
MFENRTRNYGIGNDLQPKRDMTRFVKWPKYIKRQRQQAILMKRLKVPGVINQFTRTLDKHNATVLFNFLQKYSPEDKKQKKARLTALAKVEVEVKAEGKAEKTEKAAAPKAPRSVHFGLQEVTSHIESKRAKLVVIAHDVDPIELVLWLPTLCRKKGVPYVIVKGKARLGQIVHRKTTAVLCVNEVNPEDQKALSNLVNVGVENFNNRLTDALRTPGGGGFSNRHNVLVAKEEKRRIREEKKVKK